MSVDHRSLLFDLCDNLRTPFVPRIHLLADHEDPEKDDEFDGVANNDGINGYLRMRMCDFIREYVGGSKPAILRIDDDLLLRSGGGTESDAAAKNAPTNRPDDPSNFPYPPQLGVFDDNIDKYHWAVRWHCNEYLVQKVLKYGRTVDDEDKTNEGTKDAKSESKEGAETEKEPLITVALTPNGRADAITRIKHVMRKGNEESNVMEDTYFASAAEVKMPMSAFFELLAEAQSIDKDNDHTHNMTNSEEEYAMGPKAPYHRYVDLVARCDELKKKKDTEKAEEKKVGITISNPTNNVIPYIQLQNSSLNTEYGGSLHDDVPSFVKAVGNRLFGHDPEAENLWIGSGLSTTTMHQDWYENLYWVVRGTKTFTLIPPWEAAYLEKKNCKSVKFVYEEKTDGSGGEKTSFTLQPTLHFDEENVCNDDEGLTGWISTDFVDDPAPIGARENDTRHQCHPVKASVHSGEVLYLPAMWFHSVEQQEEEDENAEDQPKPFKYNDSDDEQNYDGENGEEETTEKKEPYVPAKITEEDEGGGEGGKMILSAKAAKAPCVIAVNYWFEMHCGGPVFWMQEMLKGMFPAKKK